MALSRKQEERALSADERDLVSQSHHPAVQQLSDQALNQLTKLLRERRDKASSQANRQRREMRGKGAPKGAGHAKGDHGTRLKAQVLANAMRRLNGEAERRRQMSARMAQVASAQRALDLKRSAENAADFNTRHAHAGMRDIARTKRESLIRPMERGRLRKANAVAQAKRDNRGG